ncbi:MAG: OmpA family protein [Deltaproteobacteria bacterium]|nr:OmpA family protein [Deltaproteobacteria bacterium]
MPDRTVERRPERRALDGARARAPEHQDAAAEVAGPCEWSWSVAADPGRVAAFEDAVRSVHRGVAQAAVQMRASGGRASGVDVHATAAKGVGGSGERLPHHARIQQAFGRHDVSGVKAHRGGDAAAATSALGALAYARGESIAFRSTPDLHTAAHEAAHVIQQRAGVSLSGGLGRAGDAYERHADRVADAVVRGQSAEALLGPVGPGAGALGVQLAEDGDVKQDVNEDQLVVRMTRQGYRNPDGTFRREVSVTVSHMSTSRSERTLTGVYVEGFGLALAMGGIVPRERFAQKLSEELKAFHARMQPGKDGSGGLDPRRLADAEAKLVEGTRLLEELLARETRQASPGEPAERAYYQGLVGKEDRRPAEQVVIAHGSDRMTRGTVPAAPSKFPAIPTAPPKTPPTAPAEPPSRPPPAADPPSAPPGAKTEPPSRPPPSTEPPTGGRPDGPTPPPIVTLAREVRFEFASHDLSAAAKLTLDDVAKTLRSNPRLGPIRLEGHTDDRGSGTYNMGLSEQRANAVKTYLVGAGVDASRLQVIPLGESAPKSEGHTREAHAQNRRVAITAGGAGGAPSGRRVRGPEP